MPSALETLDRMNVHHGYGLTPAVVGTVSGFAASVALGTIYGKWRDKWYGQWSPAFFAAGGKLTALAVFLATRGRVRIPVVIANDVGQAGVNALGLNVGVMLGLKLAKKKLIIQDESAELPPGAVRVAGELPPAEPGRTLDELSVEDLANIR